MATKIGRQAARGQVVSAVARGGFSMIELVIVVSVIAVLSGLILAAVGLVDTKTKDARTVAISSTARTAVSQRGVETGGSEFTCVHPFANLTDNSEGLKRARWFRADEERTLEQGGIALATTEQGLLKGWIPEALKGNLIMDSDLFAGVYEVADCPVYFGVKRYAMRMVGSGYGINKYRRVSGPPGSKGGVDDPRDYLFVMNRDYADLSNDEEVVRRSVDLFEYTFGSHLNELKSLRGIKLIDESAGGELFLNERAWAMGAPEDFWRPGCIRGVAGSGEGWFEYRLRGMYLCDGWGREMLGFSLDSGFCFASAGEDGVYHVDPGPNGVIDVYVGRDISGEIDDVDGQSDNLVNTGKGDPDVF